MIRKYRDELNDGTSAFQMRKLRLKTGGRNTEYYELDEEQATFLISLMKNSDIVIKFKRAMVKEFFKMRKTIAALIAQREDGEWQNVRKDGKAVYFQKTNVIKQFVEYAKAQGSKSAEKYYINLANMENSALFFFDAKFPNMREIMTIKQLMQVATADGVIEKALKEGMERKLPYKECYQLAKERIVAFADIIGKSQILALGETLV